jgi:hypothetical protein
MGYTDNSGFYHEFRATLHGTSLHAFREVDANGDVGNIVANGGLLASDTTPIMRGAAGIIGQEISWAASNSDPILCQCQLPEEFDGRDDVIVELWVNSGTTDPATFTVATSWDAGATVTDTATDGAKSATTHKITATIAAADIPDGATSLTLMLTPGAHTTNAIQLTNVRVRFTERVKAAA